MRAADDADDLRLDAEVAERLDQLAADRFLVTRVGAFVAFAALERLGRRRPVVDLFRHGDAAQLAHRRQLRLVWLLGWGIDRLKVLDAERFVVFLLLDLRFGLRVGGDLGLGLGVEDRRVEGVVGVGELHGRLEVLVVLGVGAHHVGGGGRRVGAALAVLLPFGVGAGDRLRGGFAAEEDAAEERPDTATEATGEGGDRGAGQQHAADHQRQQGEDPRPDRAEEVNQAGFDPVADLAAFPAGEEHEDEVDAEGDQEEADQVEVSLLEAGREMQAGFRLCFRSFGGSFAPPRRCGALLTHEHDVSVRRAIPHPCA